MCFNWRLPKRLSQALEAHENEEQEDDKGIDCEWNAKTERHKKAQVKVGKDQKFKNLKRFRNRLLKI